MFSSSIFLPLALPVMKITWSPITFELCTLAYRCGRRGSVLSLSNINMEGTLTQPLSLAHSIQLGKALRLGDADTFCEVYDSLLLLHQDEYFHLKVRRLLLHGDHDFIDSCSLGS